MPNFLEKLSGFRKILLTVSTDYFPSQNKADMVVGAPIMENLDNVLVHAKSGLSTIDVVIIIVFSS
jgi:hypothetical protein